MPKVKKLMINDKYAFYPVFQFSLQGLSTHQYIPKYNIKTYQETKKTLMTERGIL